MSRNSIKGFTLIELLVVIAIIAILAALLTPSLKQARDLAKSVNCLSQLRQIGLAASAYIDDGNNYMPKTWGGTLSSAPGMNPIWDAFLVPYLGGSPVTASSTLLPILICPFQARWIVGAVTYASTGPNWVARSYGINPFMSESWLPSATAFRAVRNPSDVVFIADSQSCYFEGGQYGIQLNAWVDTVEGHTTRRHKGGTNVLFVDGHATWQPYDAVNGPSSAGRYDCR
jgi:prepilin-type N-terminal cleavage/methylation domain-containing protein/prepilin-type processing-associated H-X9-DG protein